MKKFVAVAMSAVMLSALCACSKQEPTSTVTDPAVESTAHAVENIQDETKSTTEQPAEGLQLLLNSIIESSKLEDPIPLTAESIFDTYGIEEASFAQAACCAVLTGVFPEEILMFEAVNEEALADIKQKLENRLSEVKLQSKDYSPENYEIAQKCAVRTSGRYVALFIAADHQSMNEAFDRFAE